MRSLKGKRRDLPSATVILPSGLRASFFAKRAVLPVIGFSAAAIIFSLAAVLLHG